MLEALIKIQLIDWLQGQYKTSAVITAAFAAYISNKPF